MDPPARMRRVQELLNETLLETIGKLWYLFERARRAVKGSGHLFAAVLRKECESILVERMKGDFASAHSLKLDV